MHPPDLTSPAFIGRWTIPAEIARVGPLVLEAAEFLEREGVSERPRYKAQLLLEEIVSNVVRHGFGGDASQRIHVGVTVDAECISLVVEDDARAFDPLHDAPEPVVTASLRDRPIGGLGLHLVKCIADEVAYERLGSSNRLRMQLHRPRAAS